MQNKISGKLDAYVMPLAKCSNMNNLTLIYIVD